MFFVSFGYCATINNEINGAIDTTESEQEPDPKNNDDSADTK